MFRNHPGQLALGKVNGMGAWGNYDYKLLVSGDSKFNGNIELTSGKDVCITNGNCLSTVAGGTGKFIDGIDTNDAVYTTGNIGIGTDAPSSNLHISSGTSGDSILTIESDTDDSNESDNPRIVFIQDGGVVKTYFGFDDDNFGVNKFGIGRYRSNTSYYDTLVMDTANGNIGIGTNNPISSLTVKGRMEFFSSNLNDANSDHYYFEKINTSSNYNSLRLTLNDDGDNESFQIWGNSCNESGGCAGPGAEKFRFTGGGKLGIGTDVPTEKLDVNGNIITRGIDFKIWNSTRGGAGTSEGRALVHKGSGTKASSQLVINYGNDFEKGVNIIGNVGIGTDTPSEKLDVNGNIRVESGGDVCIVGGNCLSTSTTGSEQHDITNVNSIQVLSITGDHGETWTIPHSFGKIPKAIKVLSYYSDTNLSINEYWIWFNSDGTVSRKLPNNFDVCHSGAIYHAGIINITDSNLVINWDSDTSYGACNDNDENRLVYFYD